MAKTRDSELRHDILGAFDKKPIQTITEIIEHLNEEDKPRAEHTIRFAVKAMIREGLIKILKRGNKGRIYYVKGMFPNNVVYPSLKNPSEPLSLMQFIGELDSVENHPLLSDKAIHYMKMWMLNAIATSDPKAYKDKRLTPPVAKELKTNLEGLRQSVEELHRFIKTFINADIWGEVGQERLLNELNQLGVSAIIVDRYGKELKNDD